MFGVVGGGTTITSTDSRGVFQNRTGVGCPDHIYNLETAALDLVSPHPALSHPINPQCNSPSPRKNHKHVRCAENSCFDLVLF